MDIAHFLGPGLVRAWLANDLEELATMRKDSKLALRLASRVLPVPRELVKRGIAQAHLVTAVSIMGALMSTAAVDGVRSGGRGRLFQTALLAFGLHGVGHLAQAAAARRWTSGSRTSPTVVLPFWILASRVLRSRGIDPREHASWAFVAALPALLAGVHALAWGLRRAAGIRRPLLGGD